MSYLLAFDIPGIQKYVYATGRLRQIIGASSIIDDFNRDLIEGKLTWEGRDKDRVIYSGGGNGKILCNTGKSLEESIKSLSKNAFMYGLNICFGVLPCSIPVAWDNFDKLDTILAENKRSAPLRGFSLRHPLAAPCGTCGHGSACVKMHNEEDKYICPVCSLKEERGKEPQRILKDLNIDGIDHERLFLKDLKDVGGAKESYYDNFLKWPRDQWTKNSRIAVVYMDGNGMGAAIQKLRQKKGDPCEILGTFSSIIDYVTRSSFAEVFRKVFGNAPKIKEYLEKYDKPLPIRPLLVGGDDVVFLIAPELVWDFVIDLIDTFQTLADVREEGGLKGLTISAGILITHAQYPLSESIEFAEQILSSAKKRGRALRISDDSPIPAFIDYEVFLDSLLDPLKARRARTKERKISDNSVRYLYCRPYVASGKSASISGIKEQKNLEEVLSDGRYFKSPDVLPRSKQKKLREIFEMDETGVNIELDVVFRGLTPDKRKKLEKMMGFTEDDHLPEKIPVMDYLDIIDHLGGKVL